MKNSIKIILFLVFLFPLLCQSQSVTTLANVTANGGISIDADGNLYVAHFGPLPPNPSIGKNIYKITPDGDVTLFVDGELNVGSGNTIDHNGFMYQSNLSTGVVYKIDQEGTIVDASFATAIQPVGVIEGIDSSIYICACGENTIKKVNPEGVQTNFVSSNLFSCVNGITKDEEGNFYTTNFSNGSIIKITPEGVVEMIGTTSNGNGHLVYRSNDQMLYIASYAGHRIYKMDLSGNVEIFAGTGTPGAIDAVDPLQATFNKPNGVNISPGGCSLYISQDNNVVREIIFEGCISKIPEYNVFPLLQLYPNPSTDKIIFKNNSDVQITAIIVTNMQGKLMIRQSFPFSEGIDTASFPSGAYSFILEDKAGNRYSKKIIIK